MNSDQLHTTAPASAPPLRRRALFAGVAAAAALGGAGVAWWRLQPHAADAAPAAELAEFWARSFEQPNGQTLALQTLRGRPLLVNFWATWCPPCVEELPLLDRFYSENRANGWQVLGLAIDQPSSVRRFLQTMPLSFPIGLAGLEGSALAKSLGNLAGGLPFSVVLSGAGGVLQRKIGKLSADDLHQWAMLK